MSLQSTIKTVDEDKLQIAPAPAPAPAPPPKQPSPPAPVSTVSTRDENSTATAPSSVQESDEEEGGDDGEDVEIEEDEEEEDDDDDEEEDEAPQQKPAEHSVESLLKNRPDIALEMRKTIPIGETESVTSEKPSFTDKIVSSLKETGEEKKKKAPAKKKKKKEEAPKKKKKKTAKVEEEEEEEEEGEESEAAAAAEEEATSLGEEEEEEVPSTKKEDEEECDSDVDPDDDVISRQKLMTSIKELRKVSPDGPTPEISMPVSMLVKIKKYYKDKHVTDFWVGVLGKAYANVLDGLAALNSAYDPFGKFFGASMNFTGAGKIVQENMSLIRPPLTYYAKKISKKVKGTGSPVLELLYATVEILGMAHQENMRKEAREAYARMMAQKTNVPPAMHAPNLATGEDTDIPTFKPQQVYTAPTTAHVPLSETPKQPAEPPSTPEGPADLIDLSHPEDKVEPIELVHEAHKEEIEAAKDAEKGDDEEESDGDGGEEEEGSDAESAYYVGTKK